MKFVTFNQIFSIFFVFWEPFSSDPIEGLSACMDPAGAGTDFFVPVKQIFGYAHANDAIDQWRSRLRARVHAERDISNSLCNVHLDFVMN